MKVELFESYLLIDGRHFDYDDEASRKLTSTTDEKGYGIFEDKFLKVWFEINCEAVDVDFGYPFDPAKHKTQEEIMRRINLVKAAFNPKSEPKAVRVKHPFLDVFVVKNSLFVEILINGSVFPTDHRASRVLTLTPYEQDMGVFTRDKTQIFHIDENAKTFGVNFAEPLDESNLTEYARVLGDRIALVLEASKPHRLPNPIEDEPESEQAEKPLAVFEVE